MYMEDETYVCKDCGEEVEDFYECDECGCILCEECRIDFTTGPGNSYGYCKECSLCPLCGGEHNNHDDFHCECGVTGCEDCGNVCEVCGEVFCEECIKTHTCEG